MLILIISLNSESCTLKVKIQYLESHGPVNFLMALASGSHRTSLCNIFLKILFKIFNISLFPTKSLTATS